MPEPSNSALRVVPGKPATGAPRPAKHREHPSRSYYCEGILRGDRIILAQAITLVESSRAADRSLAEEVMKDCLPSSGNSTRVGITGIPGAGKSSVIEALGKHLIQQRNEKVAVLTVDPSSRISGGSILGDKTRMPWLASQEQAFIRPSPTRGYSGGIAHRTREAMLLCEAAGFQNILIETVGVGQNETAVHDMVDFFLLLGISGSGDELQGIKRGVMELADLVVINKADGNNRDAAERARSEAQNALHFLPADNSGWTPRALTCSARTGHGIDQIWSCVLEQANIIRANGFFASQRREQQRHWMQEVLNHGLREIFESAPGMRKRLAALEAEVLEGRTTPFRAAQSLLDAYRKGSV